MSLAILKEFIRWWFQQMLGLLPQRISGGRHWGNALILDIGVDKSHFVLVRRQTSRETTLGRFAWTEAGLAAIRRGRRVRGSSLDLLIRLPAKHLLEHRFPIPLAAERDAANFLRYEIDRVTPFNADELFWTFETEGRDRVNGRLFIRLSMLPRTELAVPIAWLTAAGLSPIAIAMVLEDEDPRYLPLAGTAIARRKMRRSVVGLAAACAVMGLMAVALPFVVQQARLEGQARQSAVLLPRVAEVFALQARIKGQAAGADVIAAERTRVGDALQALAAVTGIMPDNSFLTALSLSKRRLALTGQSGDAAGLISAFSRAKTITDPNFSAPVTAAPNGQGNLFSITASVAP
ncbi:PilN domain-containing protein [Acidisoma cellulosilytica]|uniref:PilN domain-containing protein n=1 Tax=Acidisoma cellulosilyticum TaxID=2802395 RepID=A0A963Z6U5_9PROT|nr:PilN domain-containing protein [Acidisoma cellulosilyticum]MCB8883160.1 PilN domain-containing protein [Acidisoma cellulosilyticum]